MYKLMLTFPDATTNISSGRVQSPLRQTFAPALSGLIFPHVNVPGTAGFGRAISTSLLPVMRVCTTGIDDQLAVRGGKLTFSP